MDKIIKWFAIKWYFWTILIWLVYRRSLEMIHVVINYSWGFILGYFITLFIGIPILAIIITLIFAYFEWGFNYFILKKGR